MLCNVLVTGKELFWPTTEILILLIDPNEFPEARWKHWHQLIMSPSASVHRQTHSKLPGPDSLINTSSTHRRRHIWRWHVTHSSHSSLLTAELNVISVTFHFWLFNTEVSTWNLFATWRSHRYNPDFIMLVRCVICKWKQNALICKQTVHWQLFYKVFLSIYSNIDWIRCFYMQS